MASGSESAPPTAADNGAEDSGRAAISMPRSSAAVLTLVRTPHGSESFAVCPSEGFLEVLATEGDKGVRGFLGSGSMQKGEAAECVDPNPRPPGDEAIHPYPRVETPSSVPWHTVNPKLDRD